MYWKIRNVQMLPWAPACRGMGESMAWPCCCGWSCGRRSNLVHFCSPTCKWIVVSAGNVFFEKFKAFKFPPQKKMQCKVHWLLSASVWRDVSDFVYSVAKWVEIISPISQMGFELQGHTVWQQQNQITEPWSGESWKGSPEITETNLN